MFARLAVQIIVPLGVLLAGVRVSGAGQPLPSRPTPIEMATEQPASPAPAEDEVAPSMVGRTLRLMGRFHVVVVHFPIALLIAAGAAEGWAAWHKRSAPSDIARFCLVVGALAATAAVALGWLRATADDYAGASTLILNTHRWLGTASGLGAVGALAVCLSAGRTPSRVRLYRAMLFVTAALVGITGHFGGALVYGTDFLKW